MSRFLATIRIIVEAEGSSHAGDVIHDIMLEHEVRVNHNSQPFLTGEVWGWGYAIVPGSSVAETPVLYTTKPQYPLGDLPTAGFPYRQDK